MSRGLLRSLVATGTVAAGVDFPARTVVITAHSKRGAEGFNRITASEFQQMSGRAGRRGKDTVGFCIAAPSRFCDPEALLKISGRDSEPLLSSYFPSPSTVLNILRYQNADGLRYTVERSFASFMDRKKAEQLRVESAAINSRVEEEFSSLPKDTESYARLLKDKKRLQKKARSLSRKASEMDARQLLLLDSSLDGLRELGFLNGDVLSEKGYWSANLCTSLVLEMAELIAEGVLDFRSVEDLLVVMASISGDRHRLYLEGKHSQRHALLLEDVARVVGRVSAVDMPGVMKDRHILHSAAYTVLQWAQSGCWQTFRSVITLCGVAEGDAARLITQTAEHLNQLCNLQESHPSLVAVAEEAKNRILVPPLTEVMEFSDPV